LDEPADNAGFCSNLVRVGEPPPRMPPETFKIVPLHARDHGYVLDEQPGFLLRVAMQRYTVIFGTRMVEGLTQTQFN
jgi:hypothetical protein